MTIEELKRLEALSMSELLRYALWTTSFAQTKGSESFDKTDRLQEAYVILYEVLKESVEYHND